MGGLHIEMAIISVIGVLLEDSGWTEMIEEANITLKLWTCKTESLCTQSNSKYIILLDA